MNNRFADELDNLCNCMKREEETVSRFNRPREIKKSSLKDHLKDMLKMVRMKCRCSNSSPHLIRLKARKRGKILAPLMASMQEWRSTSSSIWTIVEWIWATISTSLLCANQILWKGPTTNTCSRCQSAKKPWINDVLHLVPRGCHHSWYEETRRYPRRPQKSMHIFFTAFNDKKLLPRVHRKNVTSPWKEKWNMILSHYLNLLQTITRLLLMLRTIEYLCLSENADFKVKAKNWQFLIRLAKRIMTFLYKIIK